MSDRLAAKKDLKRQRVLEAAKRRFGRAGIRATTMQDIAREADIAVGTIYQFFADKDALILAWVEEHRQLMHTQLADVLRKPISAEEKLCEFVTVRFHTVRMVREEPAINELTRAVIRLTPESIPEMTSATRAYLRTILEEGRRTGSLPSVQPDADSEILLHALAGFFPTVDDPILGPPSEEIMLRVVNWFISKWKLPRPRSRR